MLAQAPGAALRTRCTRPHSSRSLVCMATNQYMVSDVASYSSQLKSLLAGPAPHYVVFSSDLDANTGRPWCPDCVRTLPAIKTAVAAAGGSLLEVQVGQRPAWRSPDHPFRTDPDLKLTGIPTLLKLSPSGSEEGRLGSQLEACRTPQEAERLLTTFMAGSS